MLKNISTVVMVVVCAGLFASTAEAARPRAFARSVLQTGSMDHDRTVGHENLYTDHGGRIGARFRAKAGFKSSAPHAENLRNGVGAGPLRTRVVGTRFTGVAVVGRKFFGR